MNSHSKNRLKKQTSSSFIQLFVAYAFLLCIVLQTSITLLRFYKINLFPIKSVGLFLAVGVGISGSLFIWFHQKQLTRLDTKRLKVHRKQSKYSTRQFRQNYPKLAKIPLIGFLVRKWQEEPLLYKILLIGLCLLGGGIYMFNLSYYDWLPDESLVVGAAKGHLETGTFARWDFWMNQIGDKEYSRAWPHTLMVAQSINIFGLSEWSARLVSAIWGVVFILVLYGVSNFFLQNRMAAIIVTFACVLHPYFIVYFRRVRMYAVFAPMFILLYLCLYKLITTKRYSPRALYQSYPWMRTYFNYDWGLVLLGLVLLYLNFHIHRLTFFIFPVMLPLFLYLLIVKKHKRLLLPLLLAAVVIFGINLEFVIEKLARAFVFFTVYNRGYLEYFLEFPFPVYFSMGILSMGTLLILLGKNQMRMLSLYFLVGISILFLVYLIDFFTHFRYVLHLLPFAYMLLIGILLKSNQLFSSKWQKAIIPTAIIVLSIINYSKSFDWIYYQYPEAQFSSQAYESIQKKIKPDKEGIIALYFDSMYMEGMGHSIQRLDIPNNKQYSLEAFQKDVETFEDGAWVVWATHNGYHLREKLKRHIAKKCGKYHGHGIDDTKIEVYYCR